MIIFSSFLAFCSFTENQLLEQSIYFHRICSSNATGPGIVEEASNSTWTFQCFPLYTMLLALGNPR
jgi:hypothetical protein